MTNKPLRIGIVAGEISGDILGAGLLEALIKQYPNCIIEGIGGPKMQAAGCHSMFAMEELAVMGIFEVLPKLKRLLNIRKELVEYFVANPPDVFIGIDAPDFNLGLELNLKKAGIKTIHYVSPSVWAWREKRIFKIAKATNLVLSLFPFEKQFYDKHKVPCKFVGHTLADELPIDANKAKAREILGIDENIPYLAILPGSRGSEMKRLVEPFLQTAEILKQSFPTMEFMVPVVNKERKEQFEQIKKSVANDLKVRVVYGHSKDVMTASDAVLMASGTATLEAMLCKRPMVVAYKFNRMSYYLFKMLVRGIKFFSLPNLLAGKALVPELLQDEVEPENLAAKVKELMAQPGDDLHQEFIQLHQSIKCNASEQAANAVIEVANS